MAWRYTLHDAAGLLGLKKMGSEYHGPCLVCGGTDRFFMSKGQKHDILASCRQGCSFGEISKALVEQGLYTYDDWDKPVISQEDKDHSAWLKVIAESDRQKGPLTDEAVQQFNEALQTLPKELHSDTRKALGDQKYVGTKMEGTNLNGWEWQVNQPSWLMDKLIPGKSLGMVFGASNAGKSHWVCDLVMAMLEDQGEWLDYKIKGGAVVMFSESIGHIKARLQAYKNHRQSVIRHKLFLEDTKSFDLTDLELLRTWIEDLKERPRLLIFDTLATSFAFEENDNGEASTLVAGLEKICRDCLAEDATILIVHHTSKASNGLSARGASALIANVDWSVQCTWNEKLELTIVKWEKDRWRLLDKVPMWEGRSTKIPVFFRNADEPYEMRVLTWDEHDPLAVEAAEQLDRDRKLVDAQGRIVEAIKNMINDKGSAVFQTNRRAHLPAAYKELQVSSADLCSKALQPAISDWVKDKLDMFRREPVYTRTGIEVGIRFS